MLTRFDFEDTRNTWKARRWLLKLNRPYRTISTTSSGSRGQHADYLHINPTGKALSEFNALLGYLVDGPRYLPIDPHERATLLRWMRFQQE